MAITLIFVDGVMNILDDIADRFKYFRHKSHCDMRQTPVTITLMQELLNAIKLRSYRTDIDNMCQLIVLLNYLKSDSKIWSDFFDQLLIQLKDTNKFHIYLQKINNIFLSKIQRKIFSIYKLQYIFGTVFYNHPLYQYIMPYLTVEYDNDYFLPFLNVRQLILYVYDYNMFDSLSKLTNLRYLKIRCTHDPSVLSQLQNLTNVKLAQ